MNTEVLNRKLKFGALFWSVFAVMTPLVLLALMPWKWNDPTTSIVAACVGLPFLFSIPAYVVVCFARALLRHEVSSHEIVALLVVLVYLLVGSLALMFVAALAPYRAIGTAALACTAIILFNVVEGLGASE